MSEIVGKHHAEALTRTHADVEERPSVAVVLASSYINMRIHVVEKRFRLMTTLKRRRIPLSSERHTIPARC